MNTDYKKLIEAATAQGIANGLNELGYSVEIPNDKGEMKFGPNCHEVMTIMENLPNELLLKAIEALQVSWPGTYGAEVNTFNKERLLEIKQALTEAIGK